MATFPTYAKVLFNGYSQKKESALLRTEMDSGPPKQAKVKSKVMVVRSVKIYLSSKSDFQSFETWYDTDLEQGSSWFDFTDPVSGSTVQARFRDGGYTSTPMIADMSRWEITAQIESWV